MQKTALHDRHVALGARMVEFAGYRMPVQYTGIIEEHLAVRKTGGIFDVSHMGEIEIRGSKALEQVQRLTVNDAAKLSDGQAQYSALCNHEGGLLDDIIVYRFADRFLLIVNAANVEKDYHWMIDNRIENADIENRSAEYSLIAVQGPRALDALQPLTETPLAPLAPFHFREVTLAGVSAVCSRTGYTGEAVGFEIMVRQEDTLPFWDALMPQAERQGVVPVGLGARDTLRLEKKYCLYGNDIDETTTPLEAGLGWITRLHKPEFIGQIALRKQKADGVTRRLVSFTVEGKRIPRHGYEIRQQGEAVGQVTSGGYSPSLRQPIGMGYVPVAMAKAGTAIDIMIRATAVRGHIVTVPYAA